MKLGSPLLCVGLIVCISTVIPAQAQLITDPSSLTVNGSNQFSIFLGQSETSYDIKKANTGELTRSVFTATYTRGLEKNINLFLSAAYSFDVEDGTGYELAVGGKGLVPYQPKNFLLTWYAQYSTQSDELGEVDEITVENTLAEILLGVVAKKSIDQNLAFYAGLEFVASSSGEAISKKEFLDDFVTEFEREKPVGLKLGAIYKNYQIHVNLISETSILVGLKLPLDGISFSLPSSSKKNSPHTDKVKTQAPELETSEMPDNKKNTKIQPASTIYDSAAPIVNGSAAPKKIEKKQAPSFRDKMRQVQRKLTELGYKPGPADGVIGKNSRSALKQYQKDNGLTANSRPTAETLEKLGIK